MGAGALQHGAAQRGERAGVRDDLRLHALNDAVLIAAHGEVHLKAVALGMHQQAFRPAQLDLDGTAGDVGEQRGKMLHRHVLLAAEAAAHKGVLHLDLVIAQQQFTLVQRLVGGLVGGVKEHIPVSVDEGNGALRLQEGVLSPGGLKVVGDDVLGAGDGPRRVATADVLVGADVVLLLVKHLGSTRRGGLLRIVYRRQHLVFHLDELFGLFQRVPVLGGDERDGVPQIMGQPAHRDEGVLVMLQVADLVFAGDVLSGEHRGHAGQRLGGGGVDGQHPGAGVLAAQRAAVQHPVRVVVVGIEPGAQHLFLHVHPMHAGAKLPVVGALFGNDAGAQDFSRQLDGGHDFHIAGAAAVVVAQRVADLRLGGVGVFVQQGLAAQHHAGDAEAALHRAGLAVGEGVDLLLPLGQALDGEDAAALQQIGVRHAGLTGLAVNEDGAGAAGTLRAAVLGAGQMQLIPQKTQQLLVFGGGHRPPVHGKRCHGFLLGFEKPQGSGGSATPAARGCYFNR